MSTPELEATLGRSRNVTARHSIESLCLATPRAGASPWRFGFRSERSKGPGLPGTSIAEILIQLKGGRDEAHLDCLIRWLDGTGFDL
jgi:hypothetical protein